MPIIIELFLLLLHPHFISEKKLQDKYIDTIPRIIHCTLHVVQVEYVIELTKSKTKHQQVCCLCAHARTQTEFLLPRSPWFRMGDVNTDHYIWQVRSASY